MINENNLTRAEHTTEKWVAKEFTFVSTKEYLPASEAFYVVADAVFTHRKSGKVLRIPVFWYEKNVFKARFAPTETGLWDVKTECKTDESLNGITTTLYADCYMGPYDVYKHGFVTAKYGKKYFTYDDGTPFFYLGDTHWGMFREEMDCAGPDAGGLNVDSHFRHVVDRRVRQGFNVYQSEPIEMPDIKLKNPVTEDTMEGLKKADRYFAYIAEKGLTHTNAQFFFTSDMNDEMAQNLPYLKALSRHWVARWGAYPVMWTLAQECDNDFYAEDKKVNSFKWGDGHNPWIDVAEFMHGFDAYSHPLSGHQEGATNTTVTGRGITVKAASRNGESVFRSKEVTEKTGHNWWASQWKPALNQLPFFESAKDYWESGKISINYEGRYVNLWTNDFGGRSQGWISYLCGFFGYGYGIIDHWLYKSTYDMDNETAYRDGVSVVSVEDKKARWPQALEFPSAYHMGYMRRFFESFDWYNLVPEFDYQTHFVPDENCIYACASSNDAVVVYLYGENTLGGTLKDIDLEEYKTVWFNPRTAETETARPDGNGHFAKPDEKDWVLFAKK